LLLPAVADAVWNLTRDAAAAHRYLIFRRINSRNMRRTFRKRFLRDVAAPARNWRIVAALGGCGNGEMMKRSVRIEK